MSDPKEPVDDSSHTYDPNQDEYTPDQIHSGEAQAGTPILLPDGTLSEPPAQNFDHDHIGAFPTSDDDSGSSADDDDTKDALENTDDDSDVDPIDADDAAFPLGDIEQEEGTAEQE